MTEITKIILGNVFCIGAMLTDSFSGTRKTNKSILLVQCFTQVFYILSSFVLEAYSALAQNVVAIFRNLYAAYGKKNKVIEYFLIGISVVLGVVFNNRGLWGLIPVIANFEYSVSMFLFSDNPNKLKYAFVVNCILFAIFNFYVLNFVGGVSCIVISITTLISLYKERQKIKEENK